MDETMAARTERDDFQATRDPALMESADRGAVNLLSYEQLYLLWERQQWRTQDIDFTKDREDWQSFPEEERFQRMYGLSSFFIGEQKVADELGPIMRAAPTEEMRLFLCTQIADEARHVAFFNRFYNEENGTLPGLVEGFNNVARDEHRHVAFGARFLREMAQADERYLDAIQRTLVECGPAADGVLTPPWYEEGGDQD